MKTSQNSFETRLGRFQNAVLLLQTDANYQPSKAEITQTALSAIALDLQEKSNNVALNQAIVTNLRNTRRNISFTDMSATPDDTIEFLMRNVLNYIGAENDTNNSVYLAVKGYLRKIRPTNKPKKADGTKSPSQSERTFVSLAGYMTAVVHLISNTPDLVYSPSNPKLSISNLKIVRDQLTALNNDIAEKQSKLSQSVSDRRDSFNTTIRLLPSIKRYLASYDGGKNNSKYIQFSNALNNG